MKAKTTPKAAAAAKAIVPTVAVFAKTQNVAEAILSKAGLEPETTEIILADDNADAYKQMSAFKGCVYSTQLQDQRLGKAQQKISLFPRGGGKGSDLGSSPLAKALAAKAKKELWDVLRDPATPSEVIEANMSDPVQVIGCELNDTNKSVWNDVSDIVRTALDEHAAQLTKAAKTDEEKVLAQQGVQGFQILEAMLGLGELPAA